MTLPHITIADELTPDKESRSAIQQGLFDANVVTTGDGHFDAVCVTARDAHAMVIVDTFTFQSPDFYLRAGYEVFGQLDNFPAGASRLFMRKTFQSHTPDPMPRNTL